MSKPRPGLPAARTVSAVPALLTVLALLAGVSACGSGSAEDDTEVTLDVLAASSLTEVFGTLADDFEESHPGVRVRLSFGSSTALAQQVTEGAPADVLATADLESMDRAAAYVEATTEFATNEMVLVTPAANPADIGSLADLDRPGVQFVSCVESAPCGRVATRLLEQNGVTSRPVSLEADVKAVLAKVVADEADAGLVYLTDATASGDDVLSYPVPAADQVPARYAIGAVSETEHPDLADDWIALIASGPGQRTLGAAGFGPAGSS